MKEKLLKSENAKQTYMQSKKLRKQGTETL